MKLFKLAGWKVPPFPDVEKAIVVGGPHTSNWDGVVGLTAAVALGLNARFLIKHSLFKGPLGWLLRRLGGIPVDRGRALAPRGARHAPAPARGRVRREARPERRRRRCRGAVRSRHR